MDGHPFFIHAAEFPYYRIPRDLWNHSLDRYRELGINTIDVRIPWNWHEISEGEFDFDGRSNPRRDLRGLLEMISKNGFQLIARPGPTIGDQWKNGGYPDWLLGRAEYRMPPADRAAGLYPPAERALAANADSGAAQWLSNATHIRYATQWLTAVARELAPYGSLKAIHTAAKDTSEASGDEKPAGRLLFVFLDDAAGLDTTASDGTDFSQYIKLLRDAVVAGGLEPHFVVTSNRAENGLDSAATSPGIGIAGKWSVTQSSHPSFADPRAHGARLPDDDAQTLALLTQSLHTQTDFPAFIAGFQSGWLTPADDAGPLPSAPSNTLLGTRWLMAQGAGGIEYSPFQDTLTPPGYQTVSVNRDFRSHAALDISGERQERALPVIRNAKFLETWGEFLASSHPRAGIGLVDWSSGLSQASDIPRQLAGDAAEESHALFRRVERVALLAGLPIELVNPENQSTELLLHNSLLLLVVPDSLRGKTFLPLKTQLTLIEYVRRGGVLICNPERPEGSAFGDALRDAVSKPAGEGLKVTQLGHGRIVEWSKDFYSWVVADESFAASFARQEGHWTIGALRSAAQLANLRAAVTQSRENQAALLVNELVRDEAAEMLAGQKTDCESHPRCTQGLLSVINWSGETAVQETLRLLPPVIDARVATESDYIELPVEIPARESLMLPLDYPLCSVGASSKNCPDRIVAAGAELLGVTHEGKSLEFMLYAPTAATVIVRLQSAPAGVDLPIISPSGTLPNSLTPTRPPSVRGFPGESQNLGLSGAPLSEPLSGDVPERTLHGVYDNITRNFQVVVPRGAAPRFLRRLRIHLNYEPDVPEVKKSAKQHGKGYEFAVPDAVRLPLNQGKSLSSQPPLILLDKDHNGQFLIEAENLDDSSLTLQAAVSGVAQGSASLRMMDEADDVETIKLHGNGSADSNHDGLLNGIMNLSNGHSPDRSSPVEFLVAESDTPVHYEYDFERSGSKNWVLENKRLRLIFLPAAGGQISALVDKSTGSNLTTTVGGLRDLVAVRGAAGAALRSRLSDPMMNVSYATEWLPKDDAAIRLKAQWPEGAPIAGEITKTVRMSGKDGADTIEVEYRLNAGNSGSESRPDAVTRNEDASFVTAFSVPVVAIQPEHTQLCWLPRASQQTGDAAAHVDEAAARCQPFVVAGNPLEVPEEAGRIEVRTPGRPTLAMEWSAGRVTIEQKIYSALVLLEFPAADAAENAPAEGASYVVRYIVIQTP